MGQMSIRKQEHLLLLRIEVDEGSNEKHCCKPSSGQFFGQSCIKTVRGSCRPGVL